VASTRTSGFLIAKVLQLSLNLVATSGFKTSNFAFLLGLALLCCYRGSQLLLSFSVFSKTSPRQINQEANDFAEWLRDDLGNHELATQIQNNPRLYAIWKKRTLEIWKEGYGMEGFDIYRYLNPSTEAGGTAVWLSNI
jgi:hypothetical protein